MSDPRLLLPLVLLAGCELGIPAGSEPFYELNWVNMADQPKLKPQRADLFGARGVDLVPQPEGAVAIGAEPYPFLQAETDLASAQVNPLPASPEILEKGKAIFRDDCLVCHGETGAGDGPLTKKFPAPPSLMRPKVRAYTDGRIFHTPMRGQASMPSYAKQIEPHEIWAAVHHIRALQATQPVAPPTDADLEEIRVAEAAAAEAQAAGDVAVPQETP